MYTIEINCYRILSFRRKLFCFEFDLSNIYLLVSQLNGEEVVAV